MGDDSSVRRTCHLVMLVSSNGVQVMTGKDKLIVGDSSLTLVEANTLMQKSRKGIADHHTRG